MKKTIELASLALASALATTMLLNGYAAEKPTGKASTDAKKTADTPLPTYDTIEQVKAMPPCKATVVYDAPCFTLFRAADGKMFVIGDPGSKPEVIHFLNTLEKGQTYEFPRSFLDYQKKQGR